MATETEPRTEALPGYRLIEMIGRGGFGEVWKVEAPGGLMKACKFIHGRIVAGDDTSGVKVHRELKGLERLKAVRHPFILSLERFDIVDGQLVVIMELADRDLEHRLREVKEAGLTGIPRGEMLKYLVEAAEALDVMNVEYDIQHLDIKPSNIFLVRGHVKVADFGLSKGIEGRVGRISGGITPIYAAPETFDGWVSRHTDQYSLAILYQEMLTGMRPFPGPSPRQLMVQHMTAEPDLSSLPECDRPIVRRALSKKPDDRWETCSQFAEQILAAEAGGIENLLQAARMSVSVAHAPLPVGQPDKSTPANKETVDGLATSISTMSIPKPFLPPRPGKSLPPALEPPTTTAKRIQVTSALPKIPEFRRTMRRSDARPTLVVGLGRVGGRTIDALKQRIKSRLDSAAAESFRFLWIDCDQPAPPMTGTMLIRAGDLTENLIRCPVPPHLQQETADPSKSAWAQGQQTKAAGTNGRRKVGRAALLANQTTVRQRLRMELGHIDRMRSSTVPGGLPPVPRVVIVCAMGGGAGGGMLVDVAYWLRQFAKALSIDPFDLETVLISGIESTDPLADRRRLNHCALAEDLVLYLDPLAKYVVQTETGNQEVAGPLARDVYVVDAASGVFQEPRLSAACQNIAEFLIETSAYPIGRLVRQTETEKSWPPFRSFGLAELIDPELKTARNVAARLAGGVLVGWSASLNEADSVAIGRGVGERWYEANVAAAQVVAELRKTADERFGKTVEKAVSQTIHLIESSLGQDNELDLRTWTMNAVNRLRLLLDGEFEGDKSGSWMAALAAAQSTVAEKIRQRLDEIATKAALGQAARLSAVEAAQGHLRGIIEQLATEAAARRQLARDRLETAVEHLQQAIVRSASVVERAVNRSMFNMLKTRAGNSRQLSAGVADFARDFVSKLLEHSAAFIDEHLDGAAVATYEAIIKSWTDRAAKSRQRRAKLELFAATVESSGSDIELPAVFRLADRKTEGLEAVAAKTEEFLRAGGLGPFEQLLDAAIETAGGMPALLDRFDKEGPEAVRTLLDAAEKYVVQRLGAGDVASRFLDRYSVDAADIKGNLDSLFEAATPSVLAAGSASDLQKDVIAATFVSTPTEQSAPRFAAALGNSVGHTPMPTAGGAELVLLRIVAAPKLDAVLPTWVNEALPEYESQLLKEGSSP